MKYTAEIQSAANDPERMEKLYALARQANDEAEFRSDLQVEFEKSPENVLFSAWHARFANLPMVKTRRVINWGLAIALGIITGLILWASSDPRWLFLDQIPYFILFWAPIATIPVLIFLVLVSRRNYLYAGIAALALVLACAYILLIAPGQAQSASRDYLILMLVMLPLLCWMGLGITTLKFRSSTDDRFAFLIKSIEVIIAAGVFLAFGLAAGGITFGMFSALNVSLPDLVMRLITLGGFGLLPILAVATMYDPHYSPKSQDFNQGLSRFVFTIVRLLLPLTFVVLLIYIFVIPFNFMAPFQNRDLLIIYNVMQFAILGLLIGVTPLEINDLSPKLQTWLRRGIIAVAILASLISLYALSAVIYRTAANGLTLNRTTIIGWNVINIVIFIALIIALLRRSTTAWHTRLQNIFSKATTPYLVWSILLIVFLPLIFR